MSKKFDTTFEDILKKLPSKQEQCPILDWVIIATLKGAVKYYFTASKTWSEKREDVGQIHGEHVVAMKNEIHFQANLPPDYVEEEMEIEIRPLIIGPKTEVF